MVVTLQEGKERPLGPYQVYQIYRKYTPSCKEHSEIACLGMAKQLLAHLRSLNWSDTEIELFVIKSATHLSKTYYPKTFAFFKRLAMSISVTSSRGGSSLEEKEYSAWIEQEIKRVNNEQGR